MTKEISTREYVIKDFSANKIGYVTSGTQSPSLQKAIGLGYVSTGFASQDSEIFIEVRDKLLKAKIVKVPFS